MNYTRKAGSTVTMKPLTQISPSPAAQVAMISARKLVLKYQHKIGHLISRYVHDSHEAQDVAQEAFIKAYRGLAKFRGDSAFYTWLYRIAINTAKNHLVTMGRKISDTGIDAADAEQFEGGGALRENATPERELVRDQIAAVVKQSIADLPEVLRRYCCCHGLPNWHGTFKNF